MPVIALSEKEEGNDGKIDKCELAVFEAFQPIQPLFSGAMGKPNNDRRKQGEHVDKSKNDDDIHRIPLKRFAFVKMSGTLRQTL